MLHLCLLFRYSPLFSLVITVNLSSLLLLIYIFTLMCVESEQPSYIFYYICDLFYQFLSGFFCLSFTYLHTLHNQYTANIYSVINTVFSCVPFFQWTSAALWKYVCYPKVSSIHVKRNVYGKYMLPVFHCSYPKSNCFYLQCMYEESNQWNQCSDMTQFA